MDATEQQSLLGALHTKIERLASLIDVPRDLLPRDRPVVNGTWITLTWRETNDGDDEDGWYLSLMRNEGGHDWELSEVGAGTPNYLLYILFDEITAKLAKEASGGTSPREIWFAAQEHLLGRLNEEWRQETASRHSQMLKF